MATWDEFETAVPALASFGASLLLEHPAYLATVRDTGAPRVHPVTPIIGGGRLFVFMEPTSPKAGDLERQGWFAMHNGVPDANGTGGEFWLLGRAERLHDPEDRAVAVEASRYMPADRYVLFALGVVEARCNGYGDVDLPSPRRWIDRSAAG